MEEKGREWQAQWPVTYNESIRGLKRETKLHKNPLHNNGSERCKLSFFSSEKTWSRVGANFSSFDFISSHSLLKDLCVTRSVFRCKPVWL